MLTLQVQTLPVLALLVLTLPLCCCGRYSAGVSCVPVVGTDEGGDGWLAAALPPAPDHRELPVAAATQDAALPRTRHDRQSRDGAPYQAGVSPLNQR